MVRVRREQHAQIRNMHHACVGHPEERRVLGRGATPNDNTKREEDSQVRVAERLRGRAHGGTARLGSR